MYFGIWDTNSVPISSECERQQRVSYVCLVYISIVRYMTLFISDSSAKFVRGLSTKYLWALAGQLVYNIISDLLISIAHVGSCSCFLHTSHCCAEKSNAQHFSTLMIIAKIAVTITFDFSRCSFCTISCLLDTFENFANQFSPHQNSGRQFPYVFSRDKHIYIANMAFEDWIRFNDHLIPVDLRTIRWQCELLGTISKKIRLHVSGSMKLNPWNGRLRSCQLGSWQLQITVANTARLTSRGHTPTIKYVQYTTRLVLPQILG